MYLYNYLLNFDTGSLNTDKLYNIYFEDNIVAHNIGFPYTISFPKWQSSYDIIIENTSCGSRKPYNLVGTSTTTFPIPIYPTTNPIFVRPTTTIRPVETTQLPPSTTSQLPKSIFIDTLNVIKCIDSTDGILVSTVLTFTGNYSGKLLLQITDVSNGNIIRSFNGGIIATKTITYNLLRGNYKFDIQDANNSNLTHSRPNVYIYCPPPSFNVEYIPNDCDKINAKLRIYNIIGANKFRWCSGHSFICDNAFDTPDGINDGTNNEIIIELNTGYDITYIDGAFITVRGFNHIVSDYIDVTVPIKPCVPNTVSNNVYVTALFKDMPARIGGNPRVNVTIYLIQDGKKIIAPTDISITGYFTVYKNSTYVSETFYAIIPSGKLQTSFSSDIITDLPISESCITEINPIQFGLYNFINNSGC